MYYFSHMNEEFVHKWQSQVKKGTLSYVLLLVLQDKELYGYELIDQVKQYTAIQIAEGTLYPLMNRLKTAGLVTSKWVEQESGIPRKYYVLTPEGEENLLKMNEYWDELGVSIKKIRK